MSEVRYITLALPTGGSRSGLLPLAERIQEAIALGEAESLAALIIQRDKLTADIAAERKAAKRVEVRVITQHHDDKDARKALYRANNYFTRCTKMRESASLATETKKLVDELDALSELEVLRDDRFNELFAIVLKDKHSGEEIAEVLKTCTPGQFMDIFYAAQGYNPEPPELPSTLTGTPTAA